MIVINGIEYIERPQPTVKAPSKILMTMLAMGMMYDPMSFSTKKESPKVDIVKEFELIQQKNHNYPNQKEIGWNISLTKNTSQNEKRKTK